MNITVAQKGNKGFFSVKLSKEATKTIERQYRQITKRKLSLAGISKLISEFKRIKLTNKKSPGNYVVITDKRNILKAVRAESGKPIEAYSKTIKKKSAYILLGNLKDLNDEVKKIIMPSNFLTTCINK